MGEVSFVSGSRRETPVKVKHGQLWIQIKKIGAIKICKWHLVLEADEKEL